MRAVVAAAMLAGLLATSMARADTTNELPLEAGMRVPSGYTVVERTRKGPLIAGAVTFGSAYLLAAAFEAIGNHYTTRPEYALFVPVLGPFLQMDRAGADLSTLILATNGIAQGIGVGLLVYGLVSKKQVLVRDDLAVIPIVSASSAGLSLVGRF